MTLLQAIILAITEGITEFLPVSSTGHLVLVSHVLGIPQTDFVKTYEIGIQCGAIAAVLVYYLNRLQTIKHVWPKVLAAFIPTAAIGFLLYKIIKNVLMENPLVVVISLIAGGIILIIVDRIPWKNHKTLQTFSIRDAVGIGLFQSLSVIPGISRAAATIISGMGYGLTRKDAVEFSFLLAVPTIAAATVLDLVKSHAVTQTAEIWFLIFGSFIAFLTALVVIKYFTSLISRNTFAFFGIYRIVIAILYGFLFLR